MRARFGRGWVVSDMGKQIGHGMNGFGRMRGFVYAACVYAARANAASERNKRQVTHAPSPRAREGDKRHVRSVYMYTQHAQAAQQVIEGMPPQRDTQAHQVIEAQQVIAGATSDRRHAELAKQIPR